VESDRVVGTRELRAAEEECCDAWVVWALPKAADAYGKAILKTVDFLTGKRGVLPAAATGMAGGRRLKHRIVQVVQGRSTRSLPLWGWPCVGLLASALLLAPAPADEKPAAKAPSGGPPPASVDSAPLRGGRVDVAKGVVSVAEFLQFVVTATGLPVIPDGLERTVLGGQVHIVRPFESASLDLILFVLAASGVALEPTRLPDGSGALLARPPKKTLELTPAQDPLRGRLGAESTVSISSGHVFVLEALAFASEMTGLPVVLVPGGDWARTRTIFAPAAVQKASVEVLAAFLRDAWRRPRASLARRWHPQSSPRATFELRLSRRPRGFFRGHQRRAVDAQPGRRRSGRGDARPLPQRRLRCLVQARAGWAAVDPRPRRAARGQARRRREPPRGERPLNAAAEAARRNRGLRHRAAPGRRSHERGGRRA
jgi:hypothetical protein